VTSRRSESGRGTVTNEPSSSTTGPAPRIRVSPDSLCWRIRCSRDSATGRCRCSLIYLPVSRLRRLARGPAPSHTRKFFQPGPQGQRRSNLIYVQGTAHATAHPRWKSRHPTVKIQTARRGQRAGDSEAAVGAREDFRSSNDKLVSSYLCQCHSTDAPWIACGEVQR
jgi:hypothetical protein